MRRRIVCAALLASHGFAAAILNHTRQENRIHFDLDQGSAEIERLSPSTFRFQRTLAGALPGLAVPDHPPVPLRIVEAAGEYLLSSKHLTLTLRKHGVLLRVAKADGTVLVTDLSELQVRDGALHWERSAPPRVRYYGLGPRSDMVLDLRGRVLRNVKPFLLSGSGYAEEHSAPGNYTFDLAAERPDRYAISIEAGTLVDFFFYYGPMPKEILEERAPTRDSMPELSPNRFQPLRPADLPREAAEPESPAHPSWETLRDSLLRLAHGSLSGVLLPSFSLDPYEGRGKELYARAAQLAALVPLMLSRYPVPLRASLVPYFCAYSYEARERGAPFLRAAVYAIPNDPEAVRRADQLMLGDEILAAPIYTASDAREVYLPVGTWTRLRTNEVFRGRQVVRITAEPDELPLFVRNGTIVPLADQDRLELHYFPRLGA